MNMNDNVIEIGNSPMSQYVAYGDESKFLDTLVYSQFIVARSDVRRVEVKLRKLKSHFGIRDSVVLHLSQLMNPFQREKLGLGSLTNEDVKSFLNSLLDNLSDVSYLLKVSYFTIEDGQVRDFPD